MMRLMTRRGWLATGLSAIGAAMLAFVLTAPATPSRSLREFDADRLADLELRMWQAYYAKENVTLFRLLVTTLREQYHYSWVTATVEGFHLARAAATFGDARSDYDRVLPDLERAYTTAARRHRAGFDPAAVARAELRWWVARRTPGQWDSERVGRLIAEEYALLYEAPVGDMLRAGLLRAEAGALRDAQAPQPDWPTIGRLLRDSYRALHASLWTASAD